VFILIAFYGAAFIEFYTIYLKKDIHGVANKPIIDEPT